MKDTKAETFLRFDNVKKSYDQENLVVKGVDMNLQEGEFINLLGPSCTSISNLALINL